MLLGIVMVNGVSNVTFNDVSNVMSNVMFNVTLNVTLNVMFTVMLVNYSNTGFYCPTACHLRRTSKFSLGTSIRHARGREP